MSESISILTGANPDGEQVFLQSRMANRHGIVCGATGTGKTITLQVLAEKFSQLGVPVFAADVKGDLSGVAAPGKPSGKLDARLEKIGIAEHRFAGAPVTFWDLSGKYGHPVRTTLTDMGPLLLANLLDLNETQGGVLHIAFTLAEDEGWPLVDLKDLRQLLQHLGENRKDIANRYGSVATSSIGAIQRRLLVLNNAGGDDFFGEPALDIQDFLRVEDGQGVISLLDSRSLMMNPAVYATFLVWLLTELFKQLDEVGDLDRPRLVFFFDEAHLLFDDAPEVLVDKIEQVVRLIRSKGVGVYFVTQNPMDIPDAVLGQCGNRIQHALRAYTPKDRKAVRAAAQSFRENPKLDTEQVITELGVGEALISVLDVNGQPTPVERVLLAPPSSQFGPVDDATRAALRAASAVGEKYDKAVDRESAYEILRKRKEAEAAAQKEEPPGRKAEAGASYKKRSVGRRSTRQGYGETAVKSLLRTFMSSLGRMLTRMLRDAMSGKRRR